MSTSSSSTHVDRFGAFASGLCALHCATCALAPSVLTLLGLSALLGHEAEWGFSLLAISAAALAAVLGWRHHQSQTVAMTFGAGISGLLLARLLEESGMHGVGATLGVTAGVGLVIGHVLNLRAYRRTASA